MDRARRRTPGGTIRPFGLEARSEERRTLEKKEARGARAAITASLVEHSVRSTTDREGLASFKRVRAMKLANPNPFVYMQI